MAVGQCILIIKGGHRRPFAVGPLHVAGARLVAPYLAQVVEQGGHGHRLGGVLQAIELLHPLPGQVLGQTVVDVDAVLAQAPGVGPVESGGGGRGKKVRLVFQIVQQGVGPLPADVGGVELDEFFFVGHRGPPSVRE